jgi:hypothetical protein
MSALSPVRGEGITYDSSKPVKSDPAVRSSLSPHGERVRVRGERSMFVVRWSVLVHGHGLFKVPLLRSPVSTS